MNDLEQAQSLLRLARIDFDALRGMAGIELFADSVFGFHAQQAIEKSLKAWLAARMVFYPTTHQLAQLLALLDDDGADVSTFRPLAEFTIFAVQARYEEGIVTPADPLDRPVVVAEVGALLQHVERELTASM